jgi:hypothetical protein
VGITAHIIDPIYGVKKEFEVWTTIHEVKKDNICGWGVH